MALTKTCPACGSGNDADAISCACGCALFFVEPAVSPTTIPPASPQPPSNTQNPPQTAPQAPAQTAASAVCPHEDCKASNPPGTSLCLYCARPIHSEAGAACHLRSHVLPPELALRFQTLASFPAEGGEADLFAVKSKNPADGARYALKIYRMGFAPKPEAQERILAVSQEARIGIAETGKASGKAYELMEYAEFGSLRADIDRRPGKKIPPAEACQLAWKIALCIRAFHEAGVIHRDIKPENILLRSLDPPKPVLADFGNCSLLQDSRAFTSAARTLPYCAPEAISGILDEKSDYWSLGMVLLEAVLGRHPFAGLSDAVILRFLTTQKPDLSEVEDFCARNILAGLLCRDPKKRFGALEIGKILDGESVLPPFDDASAFCQFPRPYLVNGLPCPDKPSLAAAYAKNWDCARSDLTNGMLLAFFRDEARDHDAARFLNSCIFEDARDIDIRIMSLIFRFAPGHPPVWRGDSIEARNIVNQANKALQGDPDARHWLHDLARTGALQYAAQRCAPGMLNFAEKWNSSLIEFAAAWKSLCDCLRSCAPREVSHADFDNIYGNPGNDLFVPMPDPSLLHPQFIACAFDSNWEDKAAAQTLSRLAPLCGALPWLASRLRPENMRGAELVALRAMAPAILKTAEQAQAAKIRAEERRKEELEEAKQSALLLSADIRRILGGILSQNKLEQLEGLLEEHAHNLAKARSCAPLVQDPAENKRLIIQENVAARMIESCAALRAEHELNYAWLNPYLIVCCLVAWAALGFVSRGIIPYIPLAGLAAAFAWRWNSTRSARCALRETAKRLK